MRGNIRGIDWEITSIQVLVVEFKVTELPKGCETEDKEMSPFVDYLPNEAYSF